MSKKTKIIVTLIISVIIIGFITFLFFYKNKDGASGFNILFPFGQNLYDDDTKRIKDDDNTGNITDRPTANTSKPRLFQIHETPIAGATIFTKETEGGDKKTIVRYLERGLGHIYETDISTMEERRISNITRLKIHEALWGNNGKNVVIRYLDDDSSETIRSFVIKLSDSIDDEIIPGESLLLQKENETEGVFLPKNISDIAISKDKKKVFHIVDTGNSSIGTIYNTITNKSSQIFSSAFTEWLPQWPNKDLITLTTKPSGKVPGVLYLLNVDTEELTREIGDINGLTTLTSPNGENILYSESIKNRITLNLYNLKNKTSRKLPITTLPEKCVWSNLNENTVYCAVPTNIERGLYPDIWYQGSMSFSDEIWLIDVKSNRTKLIATPQNETREEIDMINPILDKNEEFFFFTNKKDLSLWGSRLFVF